MQLHGTCTTTLCFTRAQTASGDPYHGISAQSFPDKCTEILLTALNKSDIEIKPDGQ